MPSLPLSEVQAAIQSAGQRWVPRESEVTILARNLVPGSLFGLSIGEPERQQLMQRAIAESQNYSAVAPPPPVVDWRNHKGGNWVTRVKNQGTCGSCVAQATCAAMESRAMIKNNTPGKDIDLSEAHLFFCGGGKCATGWHFEPALEFARTNGVGVEKDFPYQPVQMACLKIPPKVEVASWSAISLMNARKLAIAGNGPVIAGMRVFSDFFSYGNGVYRHVAGAFEGLHAVTVVGYSDPDSCWIVKNSWGVDWGEGGYVRMGYGECGIDSEFPYFDAVVNVLGAIA